MTRIASLIVCRWPTTLCPLPTPCCSTIACVQVGVCTLAAHCVVCCGFVLARVRFPAGPSSKGSLPHSAVAHPWCSTCTCTHPTLSPLLTLSFLFALLSPQSPWRSTCTMWCPHLYLAVCSNCSASVLFSSHHSLPGALPALRGVHGARDLRLPLHPLPHRAQGGLRGPPSLPICAHLLESMRLVRAHTFQTCAAGSATHAPGSAPA